MQPGNQELTVAQNRVDEAVMVSDAYETCTQTRWLKFHELRYIYGSQDARAIEARKKHLEAKAQHAAAQQREAMAWKLLHHTKRAANG